MQCHGSYYMVLIDPSYVMWGIYLVDIFGVQCTRGYQVFWLALILLMQKRRMTSTFDDTFTDKGKR